VGVGEVIDALVPACLAQRIGEVEHGQRVVRPQVLHQLRGA
jgi:hypothetical protein